MTRRNILIGCGAVVVLGVLVFVALLVGIIGGSSKQSATSPAPEPGSTVAESQKNSAPKKHYTINNVEVTVGETAELRDQTLLVAEVERDCFFS